MASFFLNAHLNNPLLLNHSPITCILSTNSCICVIPCIYSIVYGCLSQLRISTNIHYLLCNWRGLYSWHSSPFVFLLKDGFTSSNLYNNHFLLSSLATWIYSQRNKHKYPFWSTLLACPLRFLNRASQVGNTKYLYFQKLIPF